MTELDAVLILQSSLTGPSQRWDAEAMLVHYGWSELAIKLAKRERLTKE